jgi:Glycosyltransferase family 87
MRRALAAASLAVALVLPTQALADVSSRQAERIADSTGEVQEVEADRGRLKVTVTSEDAAAWRVSFFDGDQEVAQVIVERDDGEVREAWTGHQVAWRMARGYEGQFGHKLNAPYVWIPLAGVFFFGLLDWRRPWRIVHLDLLVLLSFGISHIFFNDGEIGIGVPLAYPPLLYLLARMLWIGFRGRSAGLRPTAPIVWLTVGVAFLVAFRVTMNVADSGVIDVGYSGVIGADRIAHGEPIYGDRAFPSNDPTGDTYGPANYYAYVPFELTLPWSGEWDELPAAHAAAIFFDLATVAGLFLLGRRLGRGADGSATAEGNALGVVLAFAWVAYPYTAFALQSNSNDSLVAALLVWALVSFSSAWGRGALLGLAGMTKFAPLALAPLFAAGERGLAGRPPWRPALVFTAAFAAAVALMLAHPAIDPGLATFWDRTLGSQLDRTSPFSVWGQEPSLDWLQTTVWVGVAALATLVAFVPRRRALVQVAALGAAVLIAAQLAVDHWFYLYIPWFLPLLLAAVSLRGSPLASAQTSPSSSGSRSRRGEAASEAGQ